MKTIVYDSDLEELEIKPRSAIDQYRELTARDVGDRLVKPGELTPRVCPGCHSEDAQPVFEKSGLTYVERSQCNSVYISPCPTDEALSAFFRDSESARFWRDHLWDDTQQARQRKVYRPRAEWTLDTLDRYHPEARLGIDVGYNSRLFLEKLVSREGPLTRIVATNPVADIECAGLQSDVIQVQPVAVAGIDQYGPVDVVLAFDVLPCVADVEALFGAARSSLASGGLLLFSTLSISGFDLQVLWEHSTNIFPPDRINLLSVEGLTKLYERHGFEALEFSTPGVFDVEIVIRALQDNPNLPCPRFIRYLVMNRDEGVLRGLQEYLQHARLSSFARLVLRKS